MSLFFIFFSHERIVELIMRKGRRVSPDIEAMWQLWQPADHSALRNVPTNMQIADGNTD